jgi:hypothetical protein
LSYLNALASNGLSVGLQIYGTRANSISRTVEPPLEELNECSKEEEAKSTDKATKSGPTPLTAEEQAAGRAEAATQLASSGALGQIQESRAVKGDKKTSSEGQSEESEEDAYAAPQELTPEEKAEVADLKTRDREVKAHEAAHKAAAGGLAGSPSYTYETGPDGKRYAVGGEVSVHSGSSSDPAQALRDAEAIKRAAEAPASPSSQDRAVAAAASADIARLTEEVREEKTKENELEDEEGPGTTALSSQPETPSSSKFFNGESLAQKAQKAYAAVKNSLAPASKPLLARI